MSTLRFTTVIAVAASTLLATPAIATPGSGFAPSPIVSGNFGTLNVNTSKDKTDKWGLILKTLDSTDIGADRLTVQAGGYSGWHTHPAPVFVTVTQGSIVWYDGSDPLCTGHSYSAGQSFIEGAYVTHNAWSADGAQFIAVVIKPAGFPGPAFRLDRAKPNNCNF
jgi:quercetin dioxygenase-like cupin family protein